MGRIVRRLNFEPASLEADEKVKDKLCMAGLWDFLNKFDGHDRAISCQFATR